MKRKRVALYARVSTTSQTVENQLRELRQVAERCDWEIVETYVDEGISGAKGKDKRPAYKALHEAVVRKDVDLVSVWSIDRLGRSLRDLLGFLDECHAKGVHLYFHQQGIDTTTPAGKAMFSMIGVFADFERSMIQERVKAGLERAKQQGKQLGRPRISEDRQQEIIQLRKQGWGIQKIAKHTRTGAATVSQLVKAQ